MEFTQGQVQFAGCFIVVFILVMIAAYWKDRKLIKQYYKGIYKLFIVIFLVLAFYWLIVKIL